MNTRNIAILAMGLVLAAGAASATTDQTVWQQHHPRRVEVNHRLARQDARIHQERREGQIDAAKAYRLRRADARIRGQERHYAALHNGHISKFEKHRLNREENGVSRRIGA